jgi:hypothetical protein
MIDKDKLTDPAEYIIIGGGPAAICAVAKIYGSGISGNQIVWIDPQFKVGDFGTKLSVGSSVPGNTSVESYQKVNDAIYTLLPGCAPTAETKFEMLDLPPNTTCPLKIAAQPLQHITDNLRKLVCAVEGIITEIEQAKDGLRLEIKLPDGTINHLITKRIILATGAEPRTLELPNYITVIDPNIAFIESELAQYLEKNPNIKTVAVIGSSHSAALATMHLLKAGIHVIQFMNKEYKFATPAIASDGTRYTQFDNTGLKGEVAKFTQQLLNDTSAGLGKYTGKWECYIGDDVDILLKTYLPECTHAVACIGYLPANRLKINGLPLSEFKHDKITTQMMGKDGKHIPGIFGIGVAFPLEVKAISGEIEPAVGVGKFWGNMNDRILAQWRNYPADIFVHTVPGHSLFLKQEEAQPDQAKKVAPKIRAKL